MMHTTVYSCVRHVGTVIILVYKDALVESSRKFVYNCCFLLALCGSCLFCVFTSHPLDKTKGNPSYWLMKHSLEKCSLLCLKLCFKDIYLCLIISLTMYNRQSNINSRNLSADVEQNLCTFSSFVRLHPQTIIQILRYEKKKEKRVHTCESWRNQIHSLQNIVVEVKSEKKFGINSTIFSLISLNNNQWKQLSS